MNPSHAALPSWPDPQLKNEPWDAPRPRSARPIDLVHLTRQTFGDKRLETELLRLFMRQSEQIQKSLETVSDEEAQAVSSVDLLHMLSGSARAIGAADVARLAGGFEAEIRRGDKADLDQVERHSLCGLLADTNRYITQLLDHG